MGDDGTCMMKEECDMGEECVYTGFGMNTGNTGTCVPIASSPSASPSQSLTESLYPSVSPTLVDINVPCESTEDCNNGQYCGLKGMCMDDGTCMMKEECDMGEECVYMGFGMNTGNTGTCVPIASSPSASPSQSLTESLHPSVSPTLVDINVPCESTEDCNNGQYCGLKGMCMADGTCMMKEECDMGEECVYMGLGTNTGETGVCVPISTPAPVRSPTKRPTKRPEGCKNMKSTDGFLVQTLPQKKNRFVRLKCKQIKKDGHCNKKAKLHGKIKKAKDLCRASCDNCKKTKKPKPPTDAPTYAPTTMIEPTKKPTKAPKKCKDSAKKDKKYTLRVNKKKMKRTCKQIKKQNLCNKNLINLDGKPPAKNKCKKSCGVCGKKNVFFLS